MSLAGSSERIGFLRQTLARIEAHSTPAAARQGVWRSHKPDRIALGGENFSLDRVLGGGLQVGALHDIVAAHPRDAMAAAAFAAALAVRFSRARSRGAFVWIVEDIGAREEGLPYAPGLCLHGLDPARLVLVRTTNVRRHALGHGRGAEMPGGQRRPRRDLGACQGLQPHRLAPPGARGARRWIGRPVASRRCCG